MSELRVHLTESLKKEPVVSLTLYRIIKGLIQEGFDLYTDEDGRITLIRRMRNQP
jgi:hypothetical protein